MSQSIRTLSLPLINIMVRPAINYFPNEEDVVAMIDTGALYPVWCSGEE